MAQDYLRPDIDAVVIEPSVVLTEAGEGRGRQDGCAGATFDRGDGAWLRGRFLDMRRKGRQRIHPRRVVANSVLGINERGIGTNTCLYTHGVCSVYPKVSFDHGLVGWWGGCGTGVAVDVVDDVLEGII